jgi:hypothetical protein
VLGDVNRDERLDVAANNLEGKAIAVLLGQVIARRLKTHRRTIQGYLANARTKGFTQTRRGHLYQNKYFNPN